MAKFNKPPLTYSQQLELLITRGLVVKDRSVAEKFLSHVNYYRLSAYCLPYEVSRHKFVTGTTFDDIQRLYEFDQRLRFLIEEALQVIEVSVRTMMAYYLAHTYGAFVHEDASNFHVTFDHSEWLSRIHEESERSRETFIAHYKSKYDDFPKLPIWIVVEVVSFGALSKLYQNLIRKDQIALSRQIGIRWQVLASWFHTFTYVRNICAHHGRLWNRELAVAMEAPNDRAWENLNMKRIGSVIYAINQVLRRLPVEEGVREAWHTEIEGLLKQAVAASHSGAPMGLSANWQQHPLWNVS